MYGSTLLSSARPGSFVVESLSSWCEHQDLKNNIHNIWVFFVFENKILMWALVLFRAGAQVALIEWNVEKDFRTIFWFHFWIVLLHNLYFLGAFGRSWVYPGAAQGMFLAGSQKRQQREITGATFSDILATLVSLNTRLAEAPCIFSKTYVFSSMRK